MSTAVQVMVFSSLALARGSSRRRALNTCVALPAVPPCTAGERMDWDVVSFGWKCVPACQRASSLEYFYYEASCRRCASCLRTDSRCGPALGGSIDCGPHGTVIERGNAVSVRNTTGKSTASVCLCDIGWQQERSLLGDAAPCTVAVEVEPPPKSDAALRMCPGGQCDAATVAALLLCCAACITVPALPRAGMLP